MKASELRVGNLVNIIGLVPTEITPEHIKLIAEGDDQYEPIPITKEWLLKLGFQTAYNVGASWYQHPDRPRYYWMKNEDELFYLGYYGGNGSHCGSGNVPVKYIHQLQNAIFAITGIELKAL